MKILTILFLVLAITGCAPKNTLSYAKAKYLCRNHGGLYSHTILDTTCMNGKVFLPNEVNDVIIDDPEFYPTK